ncbi:MAG: 50S ribosomal protein L9, partial [Alphaproteobacteria bacterium]|nr:50S ribosomal protein L9 [Alphaproteobacteria bacterium]
IKSLGMHDITVQLHPEVQVPITANVARTLDEAEAQARGEDVLAVEDEDAYRFESGLSEFFDGAVEEGEAAPVEEQPQAS